MDLRNGKIRLTLTTQDMSYYFTLATGVKYCDERVCVSVCLLTDDTSNSKLQTLPNFMYMLSRAFDTIRCVRPVLWMT